MFKEFVMKGNRRRWAAHIPALAVGLGLVLIGTVVGQAAPPKDATGQCVDGTYTTASTKEKGCTKHGGVKTWFGDAGAPAAHSAAAAPSASASASKPAAAAHAGGRPNDATGQCADGTYTTAKTQDKGCTKHGGVKTWFGASTATPAATAAATPVAASAATPAVAQHPAARPTDATGQCADGTYTKAKTQDKGCTKHGGVKTWFGPTAVAAATPTSPAMATPAAVATPAATPATPSAAARPAASHPPAPAAAAPQVPSEPGQVWVNTSTKVYHCPGTKYYGATKAGKFMSEAEAKAAGYHADHGKACN